MIVENGGGICLPGGKHDGTPWCDPKDYPDPNTDQWVAFGTSRSSIHTVLSEIRQEQDLQFKAFAQMTLEELMALTGLTASGATAAQLRDFSEPLQWQDTEERLEWFRDALHARELDAAQGGRFVLVSGRHDKGAAVAWIRSYFEEKSGQPVRILALGDGPNDLSMLEASDLGIALLPAERPPLESVKKHVVRMTKPGPVGWNEAVSAFLNAA